MSFGAVILAYALYNLVYALAALPLGTLSDKIGRKPVIIAGWIVYAAVYLGFAAMRSATAPWGLFAAYGLYQALSEGVTKAMVADLVPADKRAGAIGLFYTVSGVGQLAASVLAGMLWDQSFAGLQAPFAIGAAFALLAVPVLAMTPKRQ
jgi:MFS family permease